MATIISRSAQQWCQAKRRQLSLLDSLFHSCNTTFVRNFNIILSVLSLNAFLTIVERLSFTGAIKLQPYDFLRLHEIIQMTIFILVSVIGPFLLIKIMSNNFALLKDTKGTLYAILLLQERIFMHLVKVCTKSQARFLTRTATQKLLSRKCAGACLLMTTTPATSTFLLDF